MEAGLSIITSLDSLVETSGCRVYRRFYKFLSRSVEEGNSFHKRFIRYGQTRKLIPAPIQEMIVTGEKSGSLPETLIKIGDIFDI